MSKITVILILIVGVFAYNHLESAKYGQLVDAIIQVESGGNPCAYNKSEKAVGVLQIRPIMVDDFNRIYGTNLLHEDAWRPETARLIALGIFKHYGKSIDRPTAKHFAFIWNGGGSAWKRVAHPVNDEKQKNLERYWSKVKSKM